MRAVKSFRRLLLPVSLLLFAAFLAPGTARSQTSGKPAGSGSPPLIDRELFFGNPEIAGAQISPDGQFIAFIKPYKEHPQRVGQEDRRAVRRRETVTADTKRPIPGYFWSRDSKYILFVQDQAGDENYNVYAVNPADSPAPGQDVPAARNITAATKGARAHLRRAEERARRDLRRAERPRRRLARPVQSEDLHRRADAPPEEHREDRGVDLRQQGATSAGPPHGRQRRHGGPPRRRGQLQENLFVHRVRELRSGPLPQGRQARLLHHQQRRAGPDGPRALRSGHGKEEFVESDPLKRVDFGDARSPSRTDEIIVTSYEDERSAGIFQGQGVRGRLQDVQKKLPGKEIGFGSSTTDEQSVARVRHRATTSRAKRICSIARARSSRLSTASARSCRANISRR